jgi:hypothetical protein
MLAQMGRFSEARREFEIALEQERGKYEDARRNLALCESLLTTSASAQLILTSRPELSIPMTQ